MEVFVKVLFPFLKSILIKILLITKEAKLEIAGYKSQIKHRTYKEHCR